MKILMANPRGFCAGVDRAISIVNRALEKFGGPIYVRHEVVHNRFVVDNLKQKGAVFVDELSEVPDDAIVIFSAHGVSKAVKKEAQDRDLKVFDATCPLVTKVHMEVIVLAKDAYDCVLIGHQGHPEVEGTMGQFNTKMGGSIRLVENISDVEQLEVKNPEKVAYVTQTTLSVDDTSEIIDALRKKFPKISGPRKDDICYATQNRQDAVKSLAELCDVVLVVGSVTSSNSNRLCELAQRCGSNAYLLDDADQIQTRWLTDCDAIGVTAGASAPEELVQKVIQRLKSLGGEVPEELEGRKENVVFSIPAELKLHPA